MFKEFMEMMSIVALITIFVLANADGGEQKPNDEEKNYD